MKKLLLLLLCVPLIGLGQWKGPEDNLLLELGICTTDSMNNPDYLPLCDECDDSKYRVKRLNEIYLIVEMTDYDYWCGSGGCSIRVYKKDREEYTLIAGFFGGVEYPYDVANHVTIFERDGDGEGTSYEISLFNDMIRVERSVIRKGEIQELDTYFLK
jgi:hypothetical protein